ncbi:MAG TPA: alpha-hydroxy-acid oxidizing protein [Solirubrobacteraceae bacterium]|jgi:isopentenyl diphosphate isomerase/L-lactate dehydrogenase-like FMN-dependent dehydrogenase|nr:alpha-hydroxy-acid oxidizing protein [Solirubrobacteraceae bacterium]
MAELDQAQQQPVFANFQFEVYAQGLAGETPHLPVGAAALQERARERLTAEAYGYVAGGAGGERTMAANLRAFERWEIVPRMLRDVSERDLSTSVLCTRMPAPILLAPIGVQSIVHPDGELAVGRAAAAHGLPAILSTAASHTLEQVAAAMEEAAQPASRWFQLYWPRDRDLAASFVARAAAAGYEAIVVTLDTWLLGWRPRDLDNAYLPFLKGEGVANYFSDPVFRAALERPPEEDPGPAIGHWAYQFANPRVTWDDLAWLRGQTTLPIVLKGVLHPEDARRARDAGVEGVIVSNHGGRQVDGSIGALDALAGVREAGGGELAILFDSGIRTGADVFKALALGADAVCLGRPFMWGLGLDGQAGVEHVLRCLLAELDLTLALSGYTEIGQVDSSALRRAR